MQGGYQDNERMGQQVSPCLSQEKIALFARQLVGRNINILLKACELINIPLCPVLQNGQSSVQGSFEHVQSYQRGATEEVLS